MNIIDHLIDEHKQIKSIMSDLESALERKNNKECAHLFKNFKDMFYSHDEAEDKIFYPALEEYSALRKDVLKGYQAHHMVNVGILELRLIPYSNEAWLPKFSIIKDNIMMHIAEEEKKLFPQVGELLAEKKLNELATEMEELRNNK